MQAKAIQMRDLGEKTRLPRLLGAIKSNSPIYSDEWYKKIAPAIYEYGTSVHDYLDTITTDSLKAKHHLDEETQKLLDVNFEEIDLVHAVFIMSQKAKPEEAERYYDIMGKLFEIGAVPSKAILTHTDADGRFNFLDIWLNAINADQSIKDFGAKAIVGVMRSDSIGYYDKIDIVDGLVAKGLSIGHIKNIADTDHKIFDSIMHLYGRADPSSQVWSPPMRSIMCALMRWDIKQFEKLFTELQDSIEVKNATQNIIAAGSELLSLIGKRLDLEKKTNRDRNTLEAAKQKLTALQSAAPQNIDLLAQSYIQKDENEKQEAIKDLQMRRVIFNAEAKHLNDEADLLHKTFNDLLKEHKSVYDSITQKYANVQPENTSWYSTIISGVKSDISNSSSDGKFATENWPTLDGNNKRAMLKEFISHGRVREVYGVIGLGIDFSQTKGAIFEFFVGRQKEATALSSPAIALALYVLDVPKGVEIAKESLSPVLKKSIQCLEGRLEKIPLSI